MISDCIAKISDGRDDKDNKIIPRPSRRVLYVNIQHLQVELKLM